MSGIPLLLILAALALAVLKFTGKVKISWLAVATLGLASFIIPILSSLLSSITGMGPDDPGNVVRDACGCGPNMKVIVRKKKLFGSTTFTTSCADAIKLDRKKNTSIVGCSY